MPKSPLDEPTIEARVIADIEAGKTNAEIGFTYDVGDSSVARFRKRHGLPPASSIVAAREPVDVEAGPTEAELLKAEVTDLKRQVGKTRKAEVAEERVLLAIERALADTPHDPTPLPAPPRAPEQAHHSQAVILSDWHAGEHVDREQMNGINAFNWAILRQRVKEIHRALLSFKNVRPHLTELQVWLLGDMVSGNIHEELRETNEVTVTQQAVGVGHLIADLIVGLVEHYPRIKVVGIAGNHARTKKDHASKNVYDSLDVVAYELAKARLSVYESVTFEIPRSAMHVQEIAGRNVLLWHGDGVRSSMPGVPWGGIMRRWNELRKSYLQRGIVLDGLVVGHFHQANAVSGGIWMNGSLIGPNEYGLKNFGSGEDPTQLLLTFDNDARRITDVSYITPTTGLADDQA